MKPLKSRWGSLKPYTRRERSCNHGHEQEFNSCSCPQWLYEHPKEGKPLESDSPHALAIWAGVKCGSSTPLPPFPAWQLELSLRRDLFSH